MTAYDDGGPMVLAAPFRRYRDERGRFRAQRWEEKSRLQQLNERAAQQLAEQWAADAAFMFGDVWAMRKGPRKAPTSLTIRLPSL